jgi:tetratricopeptide (TPR) repeat protein
VSVEMTNKPDIGNILNALSPESRESLYVLSVPNLLNNLLAEKMLLSTGKTNGNSQMLIEELRSFPIWHDRTIKTWVFDEDIREYALEKLNGSGIEIRQKVLATMKLHRKELENVPTLDTEDFDLQIARLSIGMEESRKEGIQKFRQIFDTANRYNLQETERVIDLYIEEKFPKFSHFDETLTEELGNVYFMRGLYAYKNTNFGKAISFLVPVWKKMSESYESMRDAAISAHLVGLIWSRDRKRWEEAEDAYKESLELLEKVNNPFGQAQVYHSLGILLSKDRSRWEEAEDAYKESLELLEKVNNPFGQAQVYHSLGILLSKDRSRWEEAEDAYNESLRLRKVNDSFGQAQVYHSLGNLLSKDRSRWEEAEDAYKQSLILGKDNLSHKAQVYHSLGNLLIKDRSRWEEAEDAYEQSLVLLEEINDQKGLAMICTSYGRFLINKEDFDKARIYLQKALDHEKDESYRKGLSNLIKKIKNN